MVIRNLLIDITGVVYESGVNLPINGSIKAVEKLSKNSINYAFLTNETEKTRKLLVEKLNGIGFNLAEQQIISPGIICKKYLESNSLRPHLLISPELMGDFDGIDRVDPNCVVIGDAANEFTYSNLNKAFNLLMQLETPILITMGANKFYQSYGELFLDCGAYAALLEYATGAKPKVIGKPAKEYFNLAMENFNMKPEETLMIGDDIEYDVSLFKCFENLKKFI